MASGRTEGTAALLGGEEMAKRLLPVPAAPSVSRCCWIVTFPEAPWRPGAGH